MRFYFDFISPFGYFASLRIDALAAKYGREVEWRSMLLGVSVLKVMGMKPLMETPLKDRAGAAGQLRAPERVVRGRDVGGDDRDCVVGTDSKATQEDQRVALREQCRRALDQADRRARRDLRFIGQGFEGADIGERAKRLHGSIAAAPIIPL